MSAYTMEVRDVLEHIFGTTDDPDDYEVEYHEVTFNEVKYGKLPTVPDWSKIGLGTYPIFDEAYRPIINGKIIDEYYTREIGTETIDNWTLMLRRKMDQIMPYFNKLYFTEQIPYDALDSMRIHSVSSGNVDETQNATSTNTSQSDSEGQGRAVSSNTPQTMLAGNEDYATAATDNVSSSLVNATTDQENDATNATVTASDNLVTGYQGAASDLINKYRNTLLNIDTSILLEIQDCFMALLNNGDAYTTESIYYNGWSMVY